MVFWAKISALGSFSAESEIGEIMLADVLPEELTYPGIQPALYKQVQKWLNFQSGAEEWWDILDLKNSKGEFLVTKRSPNKGYPNRICRKRQEVLHRPEVTV